MQATQKLNDFQKLMLSPIISPSQLNSTSPVQLNQSKTSSINAGGPGETMEEYYDEEYVDEIDIADPIIP